MTSNTTMKQRDFILAIVALCADQEGFGRTSLQKTAYFAGEVIGEALGHAAHFYGPFSERVESDVEDLVFAGLVEERVMSLGFVGSDGHPGKRFQYVMTAEGKERFEELQDAYGSDIQQLRSFVERLVAAAGGLDQGILSAAAKTHFIVKHEKRPVSVAEIKTFGTKLGWNLERTQMKQVAKILTELQLAQVKN